MILPKFDWKNIKWFDRNPTKEKAVIVAAVFAIGAALYQFGGNPAAPAPIGAVSTVGTAGRPAGAARAGARTISPLPLKRLSATHCFTFAPEGWRVTDSNAEGTVFGAASPNGDKIAGYMVSGVNGGVARSGYYGPQYRTSDDYALYIVSNAMIREEARYVGEAKTFGYYRVLEFSSAHRRGYVLLYTLPLPGDPGGYVVDLRIAVGTPNNPRSIADAGSVAAAMRCTAHPKPARTIDISGASTATHGTGKSDDEDVTMAGTYNAQLGTGWVHDPNTGQNYSVDAVKDYSENGPDGPGFYKRNGNDIIKLENGLSE